MTVNINGESRDIQPGLSVSTLLEQLGLNPKVVVVQRNDDIVERVSFDATIVQEGDQVELIRFVGGG